MLRLNDTDKNNFRNKQDLVLCLSVCTIKTVMFSALVLMTFCGYIEVQLFYVETTSNFVHQGTIKIYRHRSETRICRSNCRFISCCSLEKIK
jgi:hypothetical protein